MQIPFLFNLKKVPVFYFYVMIASVSPFRLDEWIVDLLKFHEFMIFLYEYQKL